MVQVLKLPCSQGDKVAALEVAVNLC